MKHFLIAGALVVGAMGFAGVASANGPCQYGTLAPIGAYGVCLLQSAVVDYSGSGSWDFYCNGSPSGGYSYDYGADHQTGADVQADGARAGAYQNSAHGDYESSDACSFDYGWYAYSYDYAYHDNSASKNTRIGTASTPTGGSAGVNQPLSGYDYAYDQEYSWSDDFSSGSSSYHAAGSSEYKSTRVAANQGPVAASAGQDKSRYSNDYDNSGDYCDIWGSCYSYSYFYNSASASDFTGAQASAGPASVTAGQSRNSYSYSDQWGSYAFSSKQTGANLNGFFTGLSTYNGSCYVVLFNFNTMPCPQNEPDIDYSAPEIPDYPAPI